MAIELATQYLSYVDEQFTTESRLSLLTNRDFDFDGAHTVKVYTVTTAPMHDYGRNQAITGDNPSRYGAIAELSASTQSMEIKKDRSFTFVLDTLDQDETKRTLEAGAALSRQLREVVIPEVDSYVYNVIVEGAKHKATKALTEKNIYDEILKATTLLDDDMVIESNRVLVVTPDTYALLKKSQDIVLNSEVGQDMRLKGVVSNLDGLTVIKVPKARLPENFGFMIAHPVATIAPVKLASYKIHDNPPGINGFLVEGRVSYDAFVLDNKKAAIYYHALA